MNRKKKKKAKRISWRNPRPDEMNVVEVRLKALRDHFKEWPRGEGNEYELAAFALYEQCAGTACCGAILAAACPLALGRELVNMDECQWVMVKDGKTWHYGITHASLEEPIDLERLDNFEWNSTAYGDYGPPDPESVILDSLDTIRAYLRKQSAPGSRKMD